MSPRLWGLVALATILVIGFGRIWAALLRLGREREEVDGFMQVFARYRDSRGEDLEAYGRLIERSFRVQELLGHVGIMAEFFAPFRAYP